MTVQTPLATGTNEAMAEDETRWRMVLARDTEAEGRFVYAVISTGVFCRPVCAARRPKRAHVRFFATAEAARAAGFRPCRRCRPLEPGFNHARAALIARLCARLATDEPPTLGELAREAGLSPGHLQRVSRRMSASAPSSTRSPAAPTACARACATPPR